MPTLLSAIVHSDDAGRVVDALRAADLRLTEVQSRGGFLRARNVMIHLGLEDEQVPEALRLIEENCRSRTMSVPLEPHVQRLVRDHLLPFFSDGHSIK